MPKVMEIQSNIVNQNTIIHLQFDIQCIILGDVMDGKYSINHGSNLQKWYCMEISCRIAVLPPKLQSSCIAKNSYKTIGFITLQFSDWFPFCSVFLVIKFLQFSITRNQYFQRIISLAQLFREVNTNKILTFIEAIGLYRKF